MAAITTYCGHALDPIRPERALIDIRDIAHALSLLCRANGHFPTFYSIAQHCLHCSAEAEARGLGARVSLACLLHDASEAYLSDITRPVKAHLEKYLEIEAKLQNAVYQKWLGIPTAEELALIREIDDTLLHHEFYAIMGEKVFSPAPTLYSKAVFAFVDFATVEKEFLNLLATLTKDERNTV